MATTTPTRRRPLLTTGEIKDMIRAVVPAKGFDAFFDADDIRNEIQNVVDVPHERITDDDVNMVRSYLDRARVTVTFPNRRTP